MVPKELLTINMSTALVSTTASSTDSNTCTNSREDKISIVHLTLHHKYGGRVKESKNLQLPRPQFIAG